MQSPERDPEADTDNAGCKAEDEVGGDQEEEPDDQHRQPVDAVGEDADRVGGERIDDVHQHHHRRDQRDRQADRLGTQDEERLAEAGEREDGGNRDHPPIGAAEPLQFGETERRAHLAALRRPLRLAHDEVRSAQRTGSPERPRPRTRSGCCS